MPDHVQSATIPVKARIKSLFRGMPKNLQAIVKKLENKEVKIDELAGTVARANELVEYCQTKLQATESEIQKIVKKG